MHHETKFDKESDQPVVVLDDNVSDNKDKNSGDEKLSDEAPPPLGFLRDG